MGGQRSGGQPGLAGGGTAQLNAAMEAWNSDLNTNIDLELTGTVPGNPGFTPNEVNNISFGDPLNEVPGTYTCDPGGGGILGQGGSSVGTPIHIYQDQSFFTVLESDVVMNDGVECQFSNGNGDTEAAEVYAHDDRAHIAAGPLLWGVHVLRYLSRQKRCINACHGPLRWTRRESGVRRSPGHRTDLPQSHRGLSRRAIFAQFINGEIGGVPNRTRVVARNNGTADRKWPDPLPGCERGSAGGSGQHFRECTLRCSDFCQLSIFPCGRCLRR